MLRRHVALAAVACLAVLGLPAGAAGHAEVRSVERVADGIRIAFTAPIESRFLEYGSPAGTISVRVDPDDRRALLARDEGFGIGPARFRVLSRDGHVTRGVLVGVGQSLGSRAVQTLDVGLGPAFAGVGRLLAALGALLLVGILAARLLVLTPVSRDGEAGAVGGLPAVIPGRLAAGTLLVGLALALGGQLSALDTRDVSGLLTDTRWGTGWLLQVAGLAVAAGGLVRSGRATPWFAGLGGSLAAGAAARSGHASSQVDGGLSVWFEIVHALATATWIGALAVLAVTVGRSLIRVDADGIRTAAAIVVRFSLIATVSVAVLVVTGVYRALGELGDLGDLVDSRYGAILLAKLAIFAMMLGVAAVNRFVAHPRIERAGLGLAPDDRGARALLRRTVGIELALALALMICVAVLGSTPPP